MENRIDGWEIARLVIILAGLLWGLWLVVGTNRVRVEWLYQLRRWIVQQASRLQPWIRVFFGL